MKNAKNYTFDILNFTPLIVHNVHNINFFVKIFLQSYMEYFCYILQS